MTTRTLSRTVLAASLVGALAVGLTGATATARTSAPVDGAPGIGDPYWPLDGNGGIDVASYAISHRYVAGDQAAQRPHPDRAHRHAGPAELLAGLPAQGLEGHRRRRAGGVREDGRRPRAADHALPAAGRGHRAPRRGDVRRQAGQVRLRRGAQLAGQLARGRDDERAAHGAVVVPGQRPPARQGARRRQGAGAARTRGDLQRRARRVARSASGGPPGTGVPTSRWCPTSPSSPPATSPSRRAPAADCRGSWRSRSCSARATSGRACG